MINSFWRDLDGYIGFQAGLKNIEGSSFEEVLAQYEEEVFRLAMVLTGSLVEAENILCEVFCAAYDEIMEVESACQWLYEKTMQVWFKTKAESRPVVEEKLSDDEKFTRNLEKAINSLPDDIKVIFVMKDIDGFSKDEISDLLDETKEEVTEKLHEARLSVYSEMQILLNTRKKELEVLAAGVH